MFESYPCREITINNIQVYDSLSAESLNDAKLTHTK